ncbi:HAMP domain-containing sensor histidine kinase [Amycolatopsis mongoliensis]|uniref:histidine kinase n=1 Tax=Amycolatopsis mongoliensis TaxID=715475 RepID=A0A9Y2NEG5_9PSEU|nr:HAMP domain-containing sensor histidine kinase [Amycolatopsis sp. 4-36]WIX98663.1 HAMP domain-containing sensor histidine kinase [Amycolatopsis sp. 4-36]
MRARFARHRSLVVRLTAVSALIAVSSIAAMAWLAAESTTRSIRQEQGQALSGDASIYNELVGYAARHQAWGDAGDTVRLLAAKTGRRIVLTTPARTPVADSGGGAVTLPERPSAVVDPLHVDPVLLPGTSPSGIDPRVVGPYALSPDERINLQTAAALAEFCLQDTGIPAQVRELPSGRPVVSPPDGGFVHSKCDTHALDQPTPTEARALAELNALVATCLHRQGVTEPAVVALGFVVTGNQTLTAKSCADSSRREQLAGYVAPPALLFVLGPGGEAQPAFPLSATNAARVALLTLAVVGLAMLVMVAVASRLARPLRALTDAVHRDVRAPVTSRDEIGYLAAAFNTLAERRERLERQRRTMIGDIAHELRNPLNAVRGRLEAAEDGHLPLDQALTHSLLEDTVLLQHIIEDLRDIAAADAGQLRIHPEAVRVADLVDHVVVAHAPDAHDVTLTAAVADADLVLIADPVRLRQAIGNLVGNALRYTPPGGQVTVRAAADGDDVVIEVADTGTGIQAEDLPFVFDRFWRADKSRARETGGSGLGLAIVRHLVEAHGGTVAVSSPAGAVFTLRLPWSGPPER